MRVLERSCEVTDVINSNSWFMAILKGFSGLPLFKQPNIFFLKLKRILGTVNK